MKAHLSRIGTVHNSVTGRERFHADNIVSTIDIEPGYIDALDGIEDFSHIMVLFWFHKIEEAERDIRKVHPRKDPSLPITGVFATRSPARPNPIGVTVVKLLKHEGNRLTVLGLDAIDSTPVLDIKPYMAEAPAAADIRLAEWAHRQHKHST